MVYQINIINVTNAAVNTILLPVGFRDALVKRDTDVYQINIISVTNAAVNTILLPVGFRDALVKRDTDGLPDKYKQCH